jgi:nucleoid-associated protein YgaU
MRWLRGLGALVLMAALLVGAPLVLLAWGRPFPAAWNFGADDGSLLLAVLTWTGWIAWVLFAVATELEMVRLASRHRFVVNLPLLGGLQSLSASLLLAVVALSPAQPVPPTGTMASAGTVAAPVTPSAAVETEASDDLPPGAGRHVVERGDDLWSLAARLLGDGSRWREVAALNPVSLADPTRALVPGEVLLVPAGTDAPTVGPDVSLSGEKSAPASPEQAGSAGSAADVDGTPRGDLARVATLGDEARARTPADEVARAGTPGEGVSRPATPGGAVADAIGDAADEVRTAIDSSPERVRVVRGDTLSGLALTHLGSASQWPAIQRANADRIDDPDHIEVGWRLVLPDAGRTLAVRERPGAEPGKVGPGSAAPGSVDPGSVGPDSGADGPVADGDPEPPSTGSGDPVLAGPAPGAGVPGPAAPPAEQPDSVGTSAPVPSRPAPGATAGPAGPTGSPADPTAGSPASSEVPADLDLALLGTLGALAAAALAGGWQARRLLRARVRAPGRRLLQPSPELARLQGALGRRQRLDQVEVLDLALRSIGRHFHRTGHPLPRLAEVVIGEEAITFAWQGPTDPPPLGFTGDTGRWLAGLAPGEELPLDALDHPCAFPALVTLGRTSDGAAVLVDLERGGPLGVAAETFQLQQGALAAMALELLCVPWAPELAVTVVGGDAALARAVGGDAVRLVDHLDEGLALIRRRQTERLAALAGEDLRRLRVDPDRAEAVAPEVFVLQEPLPPDQLAALEDLLAVDAGLGVLLAADRASDVTWRLAGDSLRPTGRLGALQLQAVAVPEPTREAVTALFELADSDQTTPAGWWRDQEPGNVRPLHPHAPNPQNEETVDVVRVLGRDRPVPTLLLLGPVDLVGTAGPDPTRSRAQLLEMCAWLLEHPGRTATQMSDALLIAEGTRRSNMSRLRTWLGSDADGNPYLPDAYSGRIRLHPEVSSDSDDLGRLTAAGVNRVSDGALVAALDLVRGGVLADAAPGQWFWAEELRSDLAATVRDAALVLVERALARDEIDLARWAGRRGLVVAPEDELLMAARIRTEHAAGDHAAAERLIARLTQQARALEVDLLPETVLLCQQVVEGRLRARHA